MTLEAVVLVGGEGTRLRPLTIGTPKPLLPVAGVPLVAHQIAKLAAVGVTRVVLATSAAPGPFRDRLGDGSALGVDLELVTEAEPLGTGGAIRNAVGALRSGGDDPVVVLNGDVLSGHDVRGQLQAHGDAGAAVTLHLTTVPDARAFGAVPTDDRGRVTAFLEKQPEPVTNQINAGCYVFRRCVLDAIPPGRTVSVERETFPALLAAGELVLGYVDPAYWLDLGTPAAFVTGSADLVTGRLTSAALPGAPGSSLLLPGAKLADGAVADGGTVVGRDCVVEAGARVDASVLLDGASVGAGATVRRSVIGRGAVVGPECVLDEAVLGDDVRIGARNELRAGARVWPGVTLPDVAVRFSPDR